MLLAFGVSAQEEVTPTYLCISDAGVGFKWKNGQWVQTRFIEQKYLIKKSYYQIGKQKSSTWAVYLFGSKNSIHWCRGGFNTDDELNCDGVERFKFSRKTLRYGATAMTSVLDPEDEPTDSMVIEHGKCSPL